MIPNNPAEIILTLDRELNHEVQLVLYGRAALCLGFHKPPAAFQATQDVDAIISLSQLPKLAKDDAFWDAIERTNNILSPKGLYITHLFAEDQVFLRLVLRLVLRSPAWRAVGGSLGVVGSCSKKLSLHC